MKKLLILTALVLAHTGCVLNKPTDTTKPTQAQLDSYAETQEPEYVCTDENDEPLKCTFDSDCCEGFVCVPDRALGHRTKTCAHE